jgi:putative ABC transport system permease protein
MQFVGEEVSAEFFKAAGTPLLRGRFFSIGDGPDAPPVAIINDAMARRSWPGHDPLGKRFRLGPRESGNSWYTVVGIVADMRAQGPEREPFPQMFVPLTQSSPPRNVDLFVRTSSHDPQAMAGILRAVVRGVEKNASIGEVATLEEQFGAYFAQRRFQTSLLVGFSIVALLMAAVGIYGLIQYSIATRTREIGIRMAVGAQAGGIFRMILGEGMILTLNGLMLGLLGALWLGQASSGLLFGVTRTDPLTFIVVSVLLIAVAIAACYFPARHAMKIEPIVALRQE